MDKHDKSLGKTEDKVKLNKKKIMHFNFEERSGDTKKYIALYDYSKYMSHKNEDEVKRLITSEN